MAAKPGKSTDILDAVALVVVDMQNSILDVIEDAPVVIERCGFAIEAARTLGLRVVFTEQVPAKLGGTDPRLLALVPNARVFPKNTFSALQAEGLLDHLRRQGVYHLLLVGIEIPVCIYQTALHAVDSDLDVTVLSDAVAGRRLDDCLVTLEALTRAHCHLLPTETVYYSMLGNSGHPLFAAFNALVKRYAQPGGLESAPPPPAPREHFHHERRPVLAAPEDHPDAPEHDDASDASDETSMDSEPYIGRNADGGPAAETRETSGSDDYPDESAGNADGDDDGEDDEGEDEDEGEENGEESSEGGNDDQSGSDSGDRGNRGGRERAGGQSGQGQGGQGQPGEGGGRRRGRRRRGGARRRRARERRDGAPSGGGHAPQGQGHGGGGGDSGGQPAPSGDSGGGGESSSSGEQRASE